MLLELLKLAESMEKSGADLTPACPDVKSPKQIDALLILLTADGKISKVSQRLKIEMDAEGLWHFCNNNHSHWPVYRPAKGMGAEKNYGVSLDEDDACERILSNAGKHEEHKDKFKGVVEVERLAKACDALLSRDNSGLRQALDDSIKAGLVDRRKKYQLVILDLAEQSCMATSVMEDVKKTARDQSGNTRTGFCALTGKKSQVVDEPMKKVSLPNMGHGSLFSRNKDGRCFFRYGTCGMDSIGIATEPLEKIYSVIQYLQDNSSNYCSHIGKDILLICYLDDGESAPEASPFLCSSDANEEACRRASKEMFAIRDRRPDARVNVLVLGRADEGNKRTEGSFPLSVGEFAERIKSWNYAGRVLEDTKCRMTYISPLILSRIFRWQFVVDEVRKPEHKKGDENPATTSANYLTALRIFFGDKALAGWMFKRLMQNSTFRYLTANPGSRDCAWVMRAMAILASRSEGEDVMSKIKDRYSWKLGRMVSLADEMHRLYVKENGSLPATLVGSSLGNLIISNPSRGMDALAQRVRLFADFARKEGHWTLMEWAKLRLEMEEDALPKFGTMDKFAFLLGTLYRPVKNVKGSDNTADAEASA